MAEQILTQLGRVDDRAVWRPSTQIQWAQEMAIKLLRREPSSDAPGRPPPSRLWTLSTHVVHQCPSCMHPHQPHWPRSRLLHRNRDRRDVIIRVSVPNTSIHRSSRSMEEGSTWGRLPDCSLQTGVLTDPPGVETRSPVAPPSPISTGDSARGRTG